MLKKSSLMKPSLLSVSISTVIGAIALGSIMPSMSAYAAGEEKLEEVLVTGSRIVRRDLESNSPIVTVDAADFEKQAGLNVESYLNQLPEYNPAASPVTSQGDVQITPVNSVGIASISLRGFGPNRSLVLVDGHRTVPINPLMVTDVNGVPSALIQRVETITGGASAVYGADAIGGVTNFILRDNFQGFELDGQYGKTDAGDGQEYRISAVMGANFADGKGNVTMGLEQYSREAAMQNSRDIYTDYWHNPTTAGYFGSTLQGVNGANLAPLTIPGTNTFNYYTKAALNALYGGSTPLSATTVVSALPTPAVLFNPDGTVFVQGNAFAESKAKIPVDGYEYAKQTVLNNQNSTNTVTNDVLKWNNLDAFASAPQDRWSFFASGKFHINDKVTAFARTNFAESTTRTLLFGTSAVGGWETFIPYDPNLDSPINPTLNYKDPTVLAAILANPAAYANPNFKPTGSVGAHFPVPTQMAFLLNSRPVQNQVWQPNWNPKNSLPPRNTYNTNEVWQVEGGLNIDLPVKDWTAELYYSHGQSSTYNVAGGNLSLARYRAVTNYPDYGRGASGTGNAFYAVGTSAANAIIMPTVRPAFGSGDFTCKSGFYDTFFGGDKPLSKDCYDAVNAVLQTRTQNQQDIIEVNLQGGLVNLPAGEVRMAGGFQGRRNKAQFNPDILQSEASFTDQVIGVYPTGYLDASTAVKDYYVEALVPVLSGIKGIKKLELELGARYSDYRETAAQSTWKALANWEITDYARVRGGFNRATRAPNLGELFLNQQEIFTGGGQFGDACSVRANAPYGAGGNDFATDPVLTGSETAPAVAAGQTKAGANSTYLICQALMGGANSVAVKTYYNNGTDVVQQGAGGGFAWVLQTGNPTLKSETADTWTLGAVVKSPWDNKWLKGLSGSFDYYNVEIKDAVMQYSLDYAAYRCFGTTVKTPAEAAIQAATLGCQLTPRDQRNGAALSTLVSYDNQANIKTSGLDIGMNWFTTLGDLGMKAPGSIALGLNATILDSYKTKTSPAPYDVETEWKGSLGPNLSGTNGGAYDYRLFGNIAYIMDNWSVSLRWRHLPGVYSAGYASQQAIKANDAAVAAGAPGVLLSYTPTTEIQTDSYDIFDFSANWNINKTFTVRGGITNLFDVAPPNVASTAGRPSPTSLTPCNGAPGCTNPSNYSLGTTAGYNGGYYDTLGRRWFVGVKASF